MKTFVSAATIASIALLVANCAQPIDANSAFTDEQYLCNADHIDRFDELVETCRAAHARDGSCAGYLSFQGVIDAQNVVVDAPSTKVDDQELPFPEGIKQGMVVWASAPYFSFRFSFVDRVSAGGAMSIGVAQNSVDFMNLEARGGNYLSNWANETREVQIATPDEVRFTFSTDLTRGGHLDGCLDVFPPPK